MSSSSFVDNIDTWNSQYQYESDKRTRIETAPRGRCSEEEMYIEKVWVWSDITTLRHEALNVPTVAMSRLAGHTSYRI